MTAETQPAPDKRHNYDYTSGKRQDKRKRRLDAIAQTVGFDTWSKLETAVINGAIITVTHVTAE